MKDPPLWAKKPDNDDSLFRQMLSDALTPCHIKNPLKQHHTGLQLRVFPNRGDILSIQLKKPVCHMAFSLIMEPNRLQS